MLTTDLAGSETYRSGLSCSRYQVLDEGSMSKIASDCAYSIRSFLPKNQLSRDLSEDKTPPNENGLSDAWVCVFLDSSINGEEV